MDFNEQSGETNLWKAQSNLHDKQSVKWAGRGTGDNIKASREPNNTVKPRGSLRMAARQPATRTGILGGIHSVEGAHDHVVAVSRALLRSSSARASGGKRVRSARHDHNL